MGCSLLALSLAIAAAAPPQAPDLSGRWSTPLGIVSLSRQGDRLAGRLEESEKGGCGLAPGELVLRGELLADSLSGDVRLCLAGCDQARAWVPALLLASPDGSRLAGALTLPSGCRQGGSPGAAFVAVKTGPKRPAQRRKAHLSPAAPTSPAAGDVGPEAHRLARAAAEAGDELQQEGRFEVARDRFLEAVRIDPSYAEGYNGVGITYRARNDLPEALRWYKRALEANPQLGDAYYNIGCVYALEGRKALSVRYLKAALRNGFTSREVMARDPDLEPLRRDPSFRALWEGP
ncbi:MAG: tetratricopeptide repeat protein [Deltaproteobacteria bacterium]